MPTHVTYLAPGHQAATGPGAGFVRLQGPQPGDVARAPGAEQRHDVPPRGHERRGRGVPVAPRVPVGVHLVAEPDDHWAAERAHAVRERAQVAVVAAGCDPRDRGQGGIPLKQCDRAVPAHRGRERHLEWLAPAAVVPDQVRLLARRPGERRDRLVAARWSLLVDPQVGGWGRGECRSPGVGRRGRRDQAADREHRARHGDRGGHQQCQARSHAALPQMSNRPKSRNGIRNLTSSS